MFVIILLVWFGLLSGHLLGNSCPLGWPYVLIVYLYFFPILVLRAGLSFRLLQFLFIAFLLLLDKCTNDISGPSSVFEKWYGH